MSVDDLRLDMDELLDELAEMRLRIRDESRVEACLDNAVAILTRMHSHVMISDIHVSDAVQQLAAIHAIVNTDADGMTTLDYVNDLKSEVGGLADALDKCMRERDEARAHEQQMSANHATMHDAWLKEVEARKTADRSIAKFEAALRRLSSASWATDIVEDLNNAAIDDSSVEQAAARFVGQMILIARAALSTPVATNYAEVSSKLVGAPVQPVMSKSMAKRIAIMKEDAQPATYCPACARGVDTPCPEHPDTAQPATAKESIVDAAFRIAHSTALHIDANRSVAWRPNDVDTEALRALAVALDTPVPLADCYCEALPMPCPRHEPEAFAKDVALAVNSSNRDPITSGDFAAASWGRGIGERILMTRVVEAARALSDLEGVPSPRETELQALVDALAALDAARSKETT